MDEADEIVEEVRVENANLDDLAQRYAGAEAALEATSNYYGFFYGVVVPFVEIVREVAVVDVESTDLELVLDGGHLLDGDKYFHTRWNVRARQK